ncbi:hypothetical protein L332_04990 [Agrococcus pavilionensis RW1]|uniref:Uncharacterized protein n=1 Tax=Agrococcus pavilionensis RW1 TaxID=1330458 RepID=U1MPJ9_9MICO|nr:DUF6350 family protein [Agrococcus pavilionensis]ERG63826.1 hypothetical protein L332_04990 [Agrococcus pavilionensis RW1]
MRRVWAGIGQAVESAAIAAVGLVLCALVLLAVWGVDQGFAGDPLVHWRIAADAWLVGHGVDLSLELGRDAVIAVGIEAASRPFAITLGAWGIGLLTLWLHWRSGRRLAELPMLDAGIATASGALATGAVGLLAAVSAQHPVASPDLAQAFALPALVALVGMVAAIVRVHGHDWLDAAARALTIEDRWMRPIRAALRTGAGGAVAVLGVGGLVLGVGLFARFADGLLVMESLQVTHLGAFVLFLLQLVLAPVAIVWAAAWAVGPGFMIGTGSHVSPLSTDLGPIPAMPLLSAIDPEAAPWMLAVVALPVVAAVVVGALARQTILAGTAARPVHWWELAIAGIGGGVLAGALLGLAAMLSSGSIGPGRLAEAGPDAVLVAAWGALEVGVGLLIGLVVGGRGLGSLAREGEGSTIREVLGLRAGNDGADASTGDADADAQETRPVAPVAEPAVAAPTPVEPAPAEPGPVEPGRVEPVAGAPVPDAPQETSPVVAVSMEDRAATQAVDPVEAPAGGTPATDDGAEPAHERDAAHPDPTADGDEHPR